MYKMKFDNAFCRRFSKEIKISYIHIIEKDTLINDGCACAEAKLHKTCLEKETCPETGCAQHNQFGEEFLHPQ